MSHRTNNIVRVLTIVSTVLLPVSVILGFFGTSNLQNVPFLTSAGGFVLMVVSMLVVTVSTLYIFRRLGWL
jgi:magnesium transporter